MTSTAATTSGQPATRDFASRLLGTKIGTTLVLVVYAIIAAGPLLLVLNNAFRPTRAIYASPSGSPASRAWQTSARPGRAPVSPPISSTRSW